MPGRNGHLCGGGCLRSGGQRGGVTLAAFWAALGFLTLFPTLGSRNPTQRQISDARAFYPLVGLLLGVLLVGVAKASALVFPVALTAALLVAVSAVATRGLHLDGLMDVCDGLFGGYTSERRLEIMRDSHVGAFAVLGASCLLLLKYGALYSLLSQNVLEPAWVLLLYPVLSRWAMVLQLGAFPYIRSSGLGSPLHQGGGKMPTGVAGLIAAGISLAAAGIGGAILMAGLSLAAWLLGAGMVKMLGGLTGDTYGATNEIIEVATIIAVVGLLPLGLLGPLPPVTGWWPA